MLALFYMVHDLMPLEDILSVMHLLSNKVWRANFPEHLKYWENGDTDGCIIINKMIKNFQSQSTININIYIPM